MTPDQPRDSSVEDAKELPVDAPQAPPTLRARRRQWMQDDLARVAVSLFLDRGFDSVSVDEIATAAGISERTFFRYFATKEAVLRRYRQSLASRLLRFFAARPNDEPALQALRNAYVESAEIAPAERPRIHALERLLATTSDVWAKDVGETISDPAVAKELARRMGLDADDLRPNVLAAATSAAAAAAWAHWSRSSGKIDPSLLVASAIDLLGLDG